MTRLLRRGCRDQVDGSPRAALYRRLLGSVLVILGKHASRYKHGVQVKVAPDQGVLQTRPQEDSGRVNRAAGDNHRPSPYRQRNHLQVQQTGEDQGGGETPARTRFNRLSCPVA